MRHFVAVVLLGWVAPVLAGASPATVDLRLREEVVTEATHYTLGEVALLESADAALVERLAELRIGRAPRVGQVSAVARSQVEARIERTWPGLRRRIHWRGPGRSVIRSVGRESRVGDYGDVARKVLEERLATQVVRWEAELLHPEQELLLPAGDVRVSARVNDGAALRPRMRVWLDYAVNGYHYASLPVWFRVSAYGSALVAQRDLPAGSALRAEDFAIEAVDLATFEGREVDVAAPLLAQRLRRPLAAGAPLVADLVEAVPDVVKGELVTVTARAGRVTVEASALALQDGRVGERIRVQRQDGEKRFAVLVTGHLRADAVGAGR